jgi:hypothetical protein
MKKDKKKDKKKIKKDKKKDNTCMASMPAKLATWRRPRGMSFFPTGGASPGTFHDREETLPRF